MLREQSFFSCKNTQKKIRKRKHVRYFECDSSLDVPTTLETPATVPVEDPGPFPETPEYYNPSAPTDNSTHNIQRKVFTSRPPLTVLQHPNPLSRPPPAAIMSLLQRLRPITINILKPATVSISRHLPNSGLSYTIYLIQ